MERWLILGAGRCGLQLARALHGHRALAGLVARSASSRQLACKVLPAEQVLSWDKPLPRNVNVLVAVRDKELPEAVGLLAGHWMDAPVVLHTSGSQGWEVLAPLRTLGAEIGVFHPLLSFPHPLKPRVRPTGATATLAGDEKACEKAVALAQLLGLRPLVCPSLHWPLYHAAATLAGPLLYALFQTARQELVRAGFPQDAASPALRALAAAVLQQVSQAQGWELLTGPLARQDLATVAAHQQALSPLAAQVYQALSQVVKKGTPDRP
jgi:predicted short-subunit dehydrogenase-like oxidoreductase (DUF2520 family)